MLFFNVKLIFKCFFVETNEQNLKIKMHYVKGYSNIIEELLRVLLIKLN